MWQTLWPPTPGATWTWPPTSTGRPWPHFARVYHLGYAMVANLGIFWGHSHVTVGMARAQLITAWLPQTFIKKITTFKVNSYLPTLSDPCSTSITLKVNITLAMTKGIEYQFIKTSQIKMGQNSWDKIRKYYSISGLKTFLDKLCKKRNYSQTR